MEIRPYQASDEAAVIELWQRCELTRPWNDPHKDIARKMAVQPELFFVGTQDGQVVASAMAGFDGHRGWVNYLAVHPAGSVKAWHGKSCAMSNKRCKPWGVPEVEPAGTNRQPPGHGLYETMGYGQDEVISLGKRLISDQH